VIICAESMHECSLRFKYQFIINVDSSNSQLSIESKYLDGTTNSYVDTTETYSYSENSQNGTITLTPTSGGQISEAIVKEGAQVATIYQIINRGFYNDYYIYGL